jgi:hypothetical protein
VPYDRLVPAAGLLGWQREIADLTGLRIGSNVHRAFPNFVL